MAAARAVSNAARRSAASAGETRDARRPSDAERGVVALAAAEEVSKPVEKHGALARGVEPRVQTHERVLGDATGRAGGGSADGRRGSVGVVVGGAVAVAGRVRGAEDGGGEGGVAADGDSARGGESGVELVEFIARVGEGHERGDGGEALSRVMRRARRPSRPASGTPDASERAVTAARRVLSVARDARRGRGVRRVRWRPYRPSATEPSLVAKLCASARSMKRANASSSKSNTRASDGRRCTRTPREYTSAARREGTSLSAATSSKKVGRASPASTWNCMPPRARVVASDGTHVATSTF